MMNSNFKKAFAITVQGASHIRKNKVCQDASLSMEEPLVVIACDGHGGADYFRSDKGSRFATEVASKCVEEFVREFQYVPEELTDESINNLLTRLESSIIHEWNERVAADVAQNPISEEELRGVSKRARTLYLDGQKLERIYGTTLTLATMTDQYWFVLIIGDGTCVAVRKAESVQDSFWEPVPDDPLNVFEETTSMCDSNALEHFRHFFSSTEQNAPVGILVASDGVDGCFGGREQMYDFYKLILYSFSKSSFEEAKADLEDYLPRMSQRGKGDDISLAAVLDIRELKELTIFDGLEQKVEEVPEVENGESIEEVVAELESIVDELAPILEGDDTSVPVIVKPKKVNRPIIVEPLSDESYIEEELEDE